LTVAYSKHTLGLQPAAGHLGIVEKTARSTRIGHVSFSYTINRSMEHDNSLRLVILTKAIDSFHIPVRTIIPLKQVAGDIVSSGHYGYERPTGVDICSRI
jgi:hypothetical protein